MSSRKCGPLDALSHFKIDAKSPSQEAEAIKSAIEEFELQGYDTSLVIRKAGGMDLSK
jgi:hypothetical protein